MWLALLIGANTATWFNTAVLVTCMRNFPHSRGTVVGILKGFVGLSGAIFTQLFSSFFNKNAESLLLFLAVAPVGVCLIAMWFVRPAPVTAIQGDTGEETSYFFFINVICLAMAFYLLTATLVQDLLPVSHLTSHVLSAVMLFFLLAPLAVPMRYLAEVACAEPQASGPQTAKDAAEGNGLQEPLLKEDQFDSGRVDEAGHYGGSSDYPLHKSELPPISELEELDTLLLVGEGAVVPGKPKKGPRRGEDFKLRQAFVKADFWLLFLTYFCGVGTGITVINNLGQIGESFGYSDASIFISLVCICNFLGRLGAGALSEYFVRLDAVPRTVWMGVAQVFMILGYLLLATAWPGTLYIGSALLGFCYGVHFSSMVPTASELFGLKHFGMIYNFITIANPVGSLLFSGWIAGTIYDYEAAKQQGGDSGSFSVGALVRNYIPWLGGGDASFENSSCFGPECYRLTFIILAGVCAVGIVLSIVLSWRIRRVYVALYKSPPRNESRDCLVSAEDGSTGIPRVGSKESLLIRNGSKGSLLLPGEPTLQRSGSKGSSYRRFPESWPNKE
eukprot:TRINITY_DN2587_c0_g2_i1.p1 TRINITY_DN2587_c0_g2~~TRINITY_DN2587_c0_g2_i1.p1  ORF type:complete len:560 (+),score=49.47 TRINITY_DN2587_c0_g2_i1:111-1790(+)